MVTVPRAAGNWQPLCAIYRTPFADIAETALHQGRNKIDPLYCRGGSARSRRKRN